MEDLQDTNETSSEKLPLSRLSLYTLYCGASTVFFSFIVFYNVYFSYGDDFGWVFLLPALLCFILTPILGMTSLIRLVYYRKTLRGWTLSLLGMTLLAALVPIIYFSPMRVHAQLVQCATQLHTVGKAIREYQEDYQGENPPTLEILVEQGYVESEMLICPLSKDKSVQNSYIYRGNDLNADSPAELIVAHDKLDNHGSHGFIQFLFADSYTKYFSQPKYIIEEDNKLRRELGLPEKPAGLPPREK